MCLTCVVLNMCLTYVDIFPVNSKSTDVKGAEQSEEEWLKQDYGEIIGDTLETSSARCGEDEATIEATEQEKTSDQDSLLEKILEGSNILK